MATSILTACIGDAASDGLSPHDEQDGGSGHGEGGALVDDDAASPCSPRCLDPSTLLACDGTTVTCQFDCVDRGTPHCTEIYPSGAITKEMLAVAGTRAITFSTTKANTETGAIDNFRPANDDPLKLEIKQGIGFQLVSIDEEHRLAVWIFESFTVPVGEEIHFTRQNAVGFVSQTDAQIYGTIDLRGYNSGSVLCGLETIGGVSVVVGGPGAWVGGLDDASAPGPGAGGLPTTTEPFYIPGPGGAGYGVKGGVGGNGKDAGFEKGGQAGEPYGKGTLVPLLGGSGGGGVRNASGGGGGGAFHLVAKKKVVIGDGTHSGGINAGGCGGQGGSMGGPGGGGGSGGAVLIEAPSLDIRPSGVIAVNGGGGGAGGGIVGPAGQLSGSVVYPTHPGGSYGASGYGGAGSQQTTGGNASPAPASGYSGGSGGGGVGRIRINNRTGSYTPPPNATISPSPQSANSTTTFGELDVH